MFIFLCLVKIIKTITKQKCIFIGYIYHPDYLVDNHLYDNGHIHHYLPSHHTPPIYQSEPLEKVCKTSENHCFNTESKIALVAPLEKHIELDGTKNNDAFYDHEPKLKIKGKYLEGTENKIDPLKITRIELEYKLKEKQQLLEIELLRQRLAETERAMANIISKMDMIPTQAQVRHFLLF